jgi:hypothetical protein
LDEGAGGGDGQLAAVGQGGRAEFSGHGGQYKGAA